MLMPGAGVRARATTTGRGGACSALAASVVCALISGACGAPPPAGNSVFTPAHRTVSAAALDYSNVKPKAEQPIPFPHKTHIEKGVLCVDCHETVEKGPIAGIPSVKTCMICHESMATDRPNIQKVADYAKRKVEIPWQRVYGYPLEAHVRFNHAPHIRAKVDCSNC